MSTQSREATFSKSEPIVPNSQYDDRNLKIKSKISSQEPLCDCGNIRHNQTTQNKVDELKDIILNTINTDVKKISISWKHLKVHN